MPTPPQLPLLPVTSIRDFYAFEGHIKGWRARLGLDVMPEWYAAPHFFFLNPTSVKRDGETIVPPAGCQKLDYELELAVVVGRDCADLPPTDAVWPFIYGFTIVNDWSARDLQATEMAVGLGPSKSKDFATSIGPGVVALDHLRDRYRDGRVYLEMTAAVNGKVLSRGNSGAMHWTWPEIVAHASRDTHLRRGDVLASGTVGTGCILELSPKTTGGWLKAGDTVELAVEGLGVLCNVIGTHRASKR